MTPRTTLAMQIEGVVEADIQKLTVEDFLFDAKNIKEIANMRFDFHQKRRQELI